MSANDLADRLYRWANGQPRGLADDLRAAAVLLREQSEQLDTLRNEVLRHRRMVEGCELVHPLPTLIEQVNGDLWAAAGGGVPEDPDEPHADADFVEVDYWCHFDDKGRTTRVHDASTVHMDGCTRMYVRVPEEGATDE